jgi:hypothetical protein
VKERVLGAMDAHPDVPKTVKVMHGVTLGGIGTAVDFMMRHEEAKEKYGKEEAKGIAAGQTVSSGIVSTAASRVGAIACSPLGPLASGACAVLGAVAANQAHDNIEIGEKTINDHVGNFVKSSNTEAQVKAALPTGIPTKADSPQNSTSLSNPDCKDNNTTKCPPNIKCDTAVGCDTSFVSKVSQKDNNRSNDAKGNQESKHCPPGDKNCKVDISNIRNSSSPSEKGKGGGGGDTKSSDKGGVVGTRSGGTVQSRSGDPVRIKSSFGGSIRSGGHGPGGMAKL